MKFQTYSYRFAEQLMNNKLKLKHEIEDTIKNLTPDLFNLSRQKFNDILKEKFVSLGWEVLIYYD